MKFRAFSKAAAEQLKYLMFFGATQWWPDPAC
jgi:hypothetical protein